MEGMGLARRGFLGAVGLVALAAAGAGTGTGTGAAGGAEAPPAATGEWLQFRGDRALTARSPLRGRISSPAIAWKHFCGATESFLASPPAGDDAPATWETISRAWGLVPSHGFGSSTSFKIADFLPDRPGLERVAFESGFEKAGTSADPNVPIYGRLFALEAGQWVEVWRSDPIPLLYSANAIAGDFDGDGAIEIACVPWYDLWVLDATTGRVEAKGRFAPPGAESGRAYGWLGAFDLDRDGRSEFIVLADFENHIDVLGWKDGKLVPLWQKLIERGITRKRTILRPGADPVQDIDADGRPEIVVSIFDAAGDASWHAVAFEGMTGEVALDIPGRYLTGLRDIDGDGVAELFLTAATGARIPEPSDLTILSFRDRKLATRWEEKGASFQLAEIADFPLHVSSGASTGRLTLLSGSAPRGEGTIFLTRKLADPRAGTVELTAWQSDRKEGIRRLGSLTGPSLDALAVGERGILLRARAPGEGPADVRGKGIEAGALLSRRIGVPLSTPVVGRPAPASAPAAFVQGACETIHAFRAAGGKTEPLWRIPGRGTYTGSGNHAGGAPFGGIVLADLAGDGTRAAIVATRGEGGCARLAAVGSDGREVWHRDFPEFPGDPPPWNVGGLTLWFAGRFTDRAREDVCVSLRRSTMHSDETFLLDGRDGRIIWKRTEGGDALGTRRGCGGSFVAVFDRDGDGLDDMLCMYPDVVFILRGKDGEFLFDRHTSQIFPTTTYYATPVVADFLGDGGRQWLYAASAYTLALLDRDGKAIWKDGPSTGTPGVQPGIGDVDGDGRIEILSPGHRRGADPNAQEFRSIDGATGAIEWRLSLPGSSFGPNAQTRGDSPMTPATADLDGDGRDECIIAIGRTLLAVGASADKTSGEVRWSLEFPDAIGPPAIADVEGSGQPQIVVVCADGFVYGIGAGEGQ